MCSDETNQTPIPRRYVTVFRTAFAAAALSVFSGCSQPDSPPVQAAVAAEANELHPVVIRQAPVPHGITTSHTSFSGAPVLLSCRACHSNLEPNVASSSGTRLDRFHQDLQFRHGNLKCVSCHNPVDDYETLRLADGQTLPYTDSIQLCAQCHGTQYDDYRHGSHGGMTGYWDLTRGGRVRNHCLHCHNTHVPAYPVFQPAPPPRDRFAPVVPEESYE